MAMAYPELFAAIIPCCGGRMAWNAHTLTMLIWAFRGLEDRTVLPVHTIEMIEKLKPINPKLKYTLLEGVYHASWTTAFTGETLRWLLGQKKEGSTANT